MPNKVGRVKRPCLADNSVENQLELEWSGRKSDRPKRSHILEGHSENRIKNKRRSPTSSRVHFGEQTEICTQEQIQCCILAGKPKPIIITGKDQESWFSKARRFYNTPFGVDSFHTVGRMDGVAVPHNPSVKAKAKAVEAVSVDKKDVLSHTINAGVGSTFDPISDQHASKSMLEKNRKVPHESSIRSTPEFTLNHGDSLPTLISQRNESAFLFSVLACETQSHMQRECARGCLFSPGLIDLQGSANDSPINSGDSFRGGGDHDFNMPDASNTLNFNSSFDNAEDVTTFNHLLHDFIRSPTAENEDGM